MAFALILLLQAAMPMQLLAPASDLNLKSDDSDQSLQFRVLPKQNCIPKDAEEIVVCGSRRDNDRYRIPQLSSEFESKAMKAESELMNGVTGGIQVDSVTFPNGTISKRIMVTVKTKF